MKTLIKKMIIGTSLEGPARRLKSHLFQLKTGPTAATVEESNRRYDIETFEVMKRVLRIDSNCVDVGCHLGEILTQMLSFAPRGAHFAFEPLPEMYEHLCQKFGNLANVRLYKLALSDKSERRTFQHVETNPRYSGFRKRRYDRPHEQIREIVVKTNPLDNLIPETISIRLIKIDVEGAELEVLKGAVNTILRSRPIVIFEHGLGAADYYGTTPDEVYGLLSQQCGLKLHVMASWLDDKDSHPLTQTGFCEQFWSGANYYFMAHP